MPLTLTQKEIVTTTEGHLVVLAGPGSGKTHTITEKIAYLIEQDAVPDPFGILAVTFTSAAANEMRRRLRLKGFRFWDRVWIGTFHGFGRYLLGCYGGDIGIREDFEILDTKNQKSLLDELCSNNPGFDSGGLKNRIESLKRQGIYPGQNDDRIPPNLLSVYQQYQACLRHRNMLDFSDLIPLSIRLLKESELARWIFSNFFRYIIVDEFQDSDNQQFLLTWGLADKAQGSTIVADDDQSIFGWRGANRTNVYTIKDKLQAQQFVLEANFRSDEVIVEAALAVIDHEQNRVSKSLKSESTHRGLMYCSGCANPIDEAEHVVKLIQTTNPSQTSDNWGNIAVIARAGWRSDQVRDGLNEASIPWFSREKLNFHDSWETSLGLAILEMAWDLDSTDGLYQVMIAVEDGGLAFRLDNEDALDVAWSIHETLSKNMKTPPTTDNIEYIMRYAGIDNIIESAAENPSDANRRKANLQTLIQDIEQEAVSSGLDLITTIKRLAGYDAVQIITGHQAKGLEFDHVFFVGLEDGILPDYRATTAEKLGEERRIFYVGLTRAKKSVCLTWAHEREMRSGKNKAQRHSRFIDHIPNELFSPFPNLADDE